MSSFPLERRIFTFWTGENPMSEARRACLESMAASECEVRLVTPDNLNDWILPDAPLHESYRYLSQVHKSDYLRAYFMHHHGGGYSDVKLTTRSWLPSFESLDATDAFGIGYREVSRKGVAHIHRNEINGSRFFRAEPTSAAANFLRYRLMRLKWRSLIGNGAYIFRSKSDFTAEWLKTIERRLDQLSEPLRLNPAPHPRASFGAEDPNGKTTTYPVPWSFICADIFHPLVYRHRHRILQGLPAPSFKNYQ
ncbi:capsular polysaccharide synthesis protein [Roseibium sp.]|uniref:capsular polysaccharide synthesis protein n=1 Tax=Roseibium sp. TaxID=1936156 RepID=UPI003A985336